MEGLLELRIRALDLIDSLLSFSKIFCILINGDSGTETYR